MMLEVHGPETPAIVAAYDFSQFDHVVDVGGGNGSLLSAVLAAHPKLRATLFDMAEPNPPAQPRARGPLPRAHFPDGRAFPTSTPEDGDVQLPPPLLDHSADPEC